MKTYEQRHSGTAIICGAAACLFDDLAKARAMRPDAVLLGCNMTAAIVPEIKHVWTQKARAGKMVRAKIPEDVSIHAASGPIPGMEAIYDCDYLWPELSWICGTSGFSAGLWAKHGMGFDEVILAGVPLSKDIASYAKGYPSPGNLGDGKPLVGYSDELFLHWMQHVRTHKKNGKTEGIFSMSGATMTVLGYPKD